MRIVRVCQLALAVGLAVPAMLAGAPRASPQDRPKIEITPEVPHSSAISAVAFSPDGRRLLSGGDMTLKLWDATTGRLIRTFEGHVFLVSSVAFSPDGTRLLSGGWDKTLKLWDAATGRLIRTFEGHAGEVRSVAFSPDGMRLLSGSLDRTLKLWDAATGRLIRTIEATAFTQVSRNSIALLPGGMIQAFQRLDSAARAQCRPPTASAMSGSIGAARR